jgi:hypothetical protein
MVAAVAEEVTVAVVVEPGKAKTHFICFFMPEFWPPGGHILSPPFLSAAQGKDAVLPASEGLCDPISRLTSPLGFGPGALLIESFFILQFIPFEE